MTPVLALVLMFVVGGALANDPTNQTYDPPLKTYDPTIRFDDPQYEFVDNQYDSFYNLFELNKKHLNCLKGFLFGIGMSIVIGICSLGVIALKGSNGSLANQTLDRLVLNHSLYSSNQTYNQSIGDGYDEDDYYHNKYWSMAVVASMVLVMVLIQTVLIYVYFQWSQYKWLDNGQQAEGNGGFPCINMQQNYLRFKNRGGGGGAGGGGKATSDYDRQRVLNDFHGDDKLNIVQVLREKREMQLKQEQEWRQKQDLFRIRQYRRSKRKSRLSNDGGVEAVNQLQKRPQSGHHTKRRIKSSHRSKSIVDEQQPQPPQPQQTQASPSIVSNDVEINAKPKSKLFPERVSRSKSRTHHLSHKSIPIPVPTMVVQIPQPKSLIELTNRQQPSLSKIRLKPLIGSSTSHKGTKSQILDKTQIDTNWLDPNQIEQNLSNYQNTLVAPLGQHDDYHQQQQQQPINKSAISDHLESSELSNQS